MVKKLALKMAIMGMITGNIRTRFELLREGLEVSEVRAAHKEPRLQAHS